MTEPVPGQTPEPTVTDAADATTPAADPPAVEQQPTETPERVEPERSETPPADAAATGPEATGSEATGSEAQAEGGVGAGTVPPNPQELFGSLSLSAIEADIDRLMNDKMSQLDGMLAGLEDLVQRLEGEITNLEPPPDDPTTPTTP